MRYLITGAGMLGSAIAERLAPESEVVLLDIAPEQGPSAGRLVRADIRDPDAVRSAAEGAEGVFHTAALHGIHRDSHARDEFMDINVGGTFTVLEAAAEAGVKRVVFSSTVGVFGSGLQATDDALPCLTEEIPCLPTDIYGLTKVLGEELCRFAERSTGLEVVAVRYGGIRQLVRRLLGGRIDAGWAVGGILTDLEDAVTANVNAMIRKEPPPRAAYTVLPTTVLDRRSLAEVGGDHRKAIALALPTIRVPDELPRPHLLFDASQVERDLAFRIAHGQDEFLREALGTA